MSRELAIISCFSQLAGTHAITAYSIRKYESEINAIASLITMAEEVLTTEYGTKYIGRKYKPDGLPGEVSTVVDDATVTVWKMEEKVVPGFVYNGAVIAPVYVGVFILVPIDNAMIEFNSAMADCSQRAKDYEATNTKLAARVKHLESERRMLMLEASQNRILMDNCNRLISEGETKRKELEGEFERWEQIVANKNETINGLRDELTGRDTVLNNYELAVNASMEQMQIAISERQQLRDHYELELEELNAKYRKLQNDYSSRTNKKDKRKKRHTNYISMEQYDDKLVETIVDQVEQEVNSENAKKNTDVEQNMYNLRSCINELANFDHSKLKSRAQRDAAREKTHQNKPANQQERLRPVYFSGDMIRYSN